MESSVVQRIELEDQRVGDAIVKLKEMISHRLIEKGTKAFASRHEAYGIIAEEFYELLGALHQNDRASFKDELIDIAVGCIIAHASL